MGEGVESSGIIAVTFSSKWYKLRFCGVGVEKVAGDSCGVCGAGVGERSVLPSYKKR